MTTEVFIGIMFAIGATTSIVIAIIAGLWLVQVGQAIIECNFLG